MIMEKYRNSQEQEYYSTKDSGYSVGVSFYSMTGVVILILICCLLSCCKSVEYVKVPEYHYETIVKTDTFIAKDSIHTSDSVYVFKNGDTVTIYKTKYEYRDRWRDRVKIDSFVKVDSIRVPYPVEKQLTKWEKLKQDIGGIVMLLLALCIAVILCLIFSKIRKKCIG